MTAHSLERRQVTVLVVDDSDDQRHLMRAHFQRAGCDVLLAGTGEEGVAKARIYGPQLAVVDLLLPGISGWQVAAQLRTDVPNCAIAISSVLDAGEYPAADARLPKPVTGDQIRRMLAQLVPDWRAR